MAEADGDASGGEAAAAKRPNAEDSLGLHGAERMAGIEWQLTAKLLLEQVVGIHDPDLAILADPGLSARHVVARDEEDAVFPRH